MTAKKKNRSKPKLTEIPPEITYKPSVLFFGFLGSVCGFTLSYSIIKAIEIAHPVFVYPISLSALGLLYALSRLVPHCFSITLDAYGMRVTRYFRSEYYPWSIISNVYIFGETSFKQIRFDLATEEGKWPRFFGEGDMVIGGSYFSKIPDIQFKMREHKQKNKRLGLSMFNPNPSNGFYKNRKFFWGRSGSEKEEAIPKLTIWEKIHNWRNQ